MTKSKAGRPTLYREELNETARKLATAGYSDEKIADFIGVSKQTFYDWQKKHPEFLDSLSKGKQLLVASIARSMCQRAMGYATEEIREKVDPATNLVLERNIIKKRIPADVGAATLLLKAKAPEIYNRRQEIDVISSDGSMAARTLESFYESAE